MCLLQVFRRFGQRQVVGSQCGFSLEQHAQQSVECLNQLAQFILPARWQQLQLHLSPRLRGHALSGGINGAELMPQQPEDQPRSQQTHEQCGHDQGVPNVCHGSKHFVHGYGGQQRPVGNGQILGRHQQRLALCVAQHGRACFARQQLVKPRAQFQVGNRLERERPVAAGHDQFPVFRHQGVLAALPELGIQDAVQKVGFGQVDDAHKGANDRTRTVPDRCSKAHHRLLDVFANDGLTDFAGVVGQRVCHAVAVAEVQAQPAKRCWHGGNGHALGVGDERAAIEE